LEADPDVRGEWARALGNERSAVDAAGERAT
jgi:hypothetical protein